MLRLMLVEKKNHDVTGQQKYRQDENLTLD